MVGPPLWKIWLRQLGWWQQPNISGKIIQMATKPPTRDGEPLAWVGWVSPHEHSATWPRNFYHEKTPPWRPGIQRAFFFRQLKAIERRPHPFFLGRLSLFGLWPPKSTSGSACFHLIGWPKVDMAMKTTSGKPGSSGVLNGEFQDPRMELRSHHA